MKVSFLLLNYTLFLLWQVISSSPNTSHLPCLLSSLAMIPVGVLSPYPPSSKLDVILNGRVVGQVATGQAQELALQLRTLKAMGKDKVCLHSVCVWPGGVGSSTTYHSIVYRWHYLLVTILQVVTWVIYVTWEWQIILPRCSPIINLNT